jgi:hypothetical protein
MARSVWMFDSSLTVACPCPGALRLDVVRIVGGDGIEVDVTIVPDPALPASTMDRIAAKRLLGDTLATLDAAGLVTEGAGAGRLREIVNAALVAFAEVEALERRLARAEQETRLAQEAGQRQADHAKRLEQDALRVVIADLWASAPEAMRAEVLAAIPSDQREAVEPFLRAALK